MTAITSGGTLTQQLYQRLFDRLNTNADDAVSFDEMSAAGTSFSKADAAFNALDANGDGRVVRAEMTPSSTFGADTLNAMLSAQTGQAPQTQEEIIKALFARADADGDGALSADEMKAEAAIKQAAALDAGYSPDVTYLKVAGDSDGLLQRDEIMVARRLHIPASAIRSIDELPAGIADRLRDATRAYGEEPAAGGQVSPPSEPLTPEQRQARLDQMRADLIERDSGPAGTTRYLSRELGGLRDQARADLDQTPMTNSLVSRLMQQIVAGWSAAPADAPSQT
ncbi:hypothetical protein [Caulobacter sp.]|uniref:EF-hand domain-containing protein n=1 Tax=Caulobacter sp. TaxID=78 RepID=UPI003BAA10E1